MYPFLMPHKKASTSLVVSYNIFPFRRKDEELKLQGLGFLLETEETPPGASVSRPQKLANKRRPLKGRNINHKAAQAAQGPLPVSLLETAL
jgi:hypothetical protein